MQVDANTNYIATVLGRVITVTRTNGQTVSAGLVIDTDSSGAASITPQLLFTAADWNQAQKVRVFAIDDKVRDGGDVKVIAALDQERVNTIRGPLTIDGGVRANADLFLDNPLTLPGETNFPLADGEIAAAGTLSAGTSVQATITDPNATYIDPLRGVMPGFDPRIKDFNFGFTLIDLASHAIIDTLEADTLIGHGIAVRAESGGTFSVTGGAGLSGTGETATTYNAANIALEGLVTANQVWSVKLNAVTHSYTTNATDGLTLFVVAEKLADQINNFAGFTATQASGRTIKVAGGASFTATLTAGTGRISGSSTANRSQ